jgi:hypothetical protein
MPAIDVPVEQRAEYNRILEQLFRQRHSKHHCHQFQTQRRLQGHHEVQEECQTAQAFLVLVASTLSFVYLNKHTELVARVSREYFRFFGGSGGVSPDES